MASPPGRKWLPANGLRCSLWFPPTLRTSGIIICFRVSLSSQTPKMFPRLFPAMTPLSYQQRQTFISTEGWALGESFYEDKLMQGQWFLWTQPMRDVAIPGGCRCSVGERALAALVSAPEVGESLRRRRGGTAFWSRPGCCGSQGGAGKGQSAALAAGLHAAPLSVSPTQTPHFLPLEANLKPAGAGPHEPGHGDERRISPYTHSN